MMSHKGRVGIIGATSIIGEYLLPLLVKEGWDVTAFSRREQNVKPLEKVPLTWQLLARSGSAGSNDVHQKGKQITCWISLAPIAALPEYFPMLLAYGAKHIVAVSSTSRFTKKASPDPEEKKMAEDLALNEESLSAWAQKKKITFTILRPTLVYSPGRDKNISVIASFIQRFSFFCILGEAKGLRQPVHAQDVASACAAALSAQSAINNSYNISGGEIITYREMVCRIFSALGKYPKFVKFPFWLFRCAVFILRIFPRFRQWSAAMAQRMDQDMVFDNAEARKDLGFAPRPFNLQGFNQLTGKNILIFEEN